MSNPTTAGVHGRIVGIVRGREIDAAATISLAGSVLELQWTGATPWRLALEAIDGLALSGSHLTLYLASGDVLDCAGDGSMQAFGSQLIDQACAMPELTRGLVALGSLRGSPGASHDSWFAPLLTARRSVEGVSDPLRQLTLVDAAQLERAFEGVIAQLAAVKAPTDQAMQRAIEARLEEAAVPLFQALTRLALSADSLRGSALDTRLADWRKWVAALREVFKAADAAWRDCAAQLERVGA